MEVLRQHSHGSEELLKAEVIAAERAEAETWVKAYQQFEDDLIRAGKDPELEANLVAFYETHGKAVTPVQAEWSDWLPRDRAARSMLFIGVFLVASFLSIVLWIWLWLRRRRKQRRARFI
jgi:hypothetical protein